MAFPKRARNDEDKLERKRTILKTAWKLYESSGGRLPAVSEIAAEAELSKGAIYLYFRSKEEIYLELYVQKLSEWTTSRKCSSGRKEGREDISVDEFASRFTRYIRENPLILTLGSIVKGVLEANTEDGIIIENKARAASLLNRGGEVIERQFPGIPREDAVKLMLQIIALINGLWQFASMPENIRMGLKQKGIDAFEMDFPDIAQKAVSALIRGTLCKV